jgi:hypothetical protein
LRNRRGGLLSRNSVAKILNNPFYTGLISIKTTGECYPGRHEPLISMGLFNQVQARLAGKIRSTKWVHDFTLRGLFHCSLCGRCLTGEMQKGHAYYRCHTRDCPTKGFREEVLENALLNAWPDVTLTAEAKQHIAERLTCLDRYLPCCDNRSAAANKI